MQDFSIRLQVDEEDEIDLSSDTLDLDVELPPHMSVTPEQLKVLLQRLGNVLRTELAHTFPGADITTCR